MMQTTNHYNNLPYNVKQFFDTQYRDSIRLLEASRHPNTGLYADSFLTMDKNPDTRCSIAATGVGLIGLCVSDMEGWDSEAAQKVLITLKTVLGQKKGCCVSRDLKSGFFAHFVDSETGENIHSEFSTIDTSLLVAGALFAGNHFKKTHPEIMELANDLLHSIDWRIVVNDKDKGVINMISKEGKGIAPLPAYNEYVLVSYLAKLCQPDSEDIINLWDNTFALDKINQLPKSIYRDIQVLTDRENHFLSSFVHQFPFYLVPEYTTSSVYRKYFKNACMADRLKWKELDVPSFVWGYGAGSNKGLYDEYHADRINDSKRNIASAYIVAGFLPVYPEGIYDLYALYQHIPYNHYKNPHDKEDEIKFRSSYQYGLHRYSWSHLKENNRWYPLVITVIDWSSMIYGLTAFKRGLTFFTERLTKA
ncbi:hypothetical protein KHQ81_01390 [Mycoplasmatota bacterium]|nr:hypothetical protein KHQ81_01390 [Mycoplasmatota bacterium]